MRKVLLAAAMMAGFTLTALNAAAAPSSGLAAVRSASSHSMVTNIDYYYNHRHWRHRRWSGHRWRYW